MVFITKPIYCFLLWHQQNLCIAYLKRHGFVDVCNYVSGPTSYAPIVEAAINIVEKSGGQFHTLFIITDDQVVSKFFIAPLLSPLSFLTQIDMLHAPKLS